jgi:hypothetical protein
MGLCLSNFPTHKIGVYLFPHTHKTKRTIKIKNPKKSIENAKRREKKNQQEKININKIFKPQKNYLKTISKNKKKGKKR